nr:hypothetical protein [Tanacetum cinerariifolium]
MGRDTIQLETAVSTISQEYLLEFTSEYGIPKGLHSEFPGPEDTIVDFSEGKVGVYTKFFEFANFRIPISQFLFDILDHYQIHLSQLFFWVDERVFPTVVDWRTNAPKDGIPAANSYSEADVEVLNTRRTPIQKQPEALLCLVGLGRRYFLGDNVYPTFLHNDNWDGCLNIVSNASHIHENKLIVPYECRYGFVQLNQRSKSHQGKTRVHPPAAHKVPLLTVTANRVIDMEDPVVTSTSSNTLSVMEKSLLYFSSEDPPPMITDKGETEDYALAVVSQEVPSAENTTTAKVVPKLNLEKEAPLWDLLSMKRVTREIKARWRRMHLPRY